MNKMNFDKNKFNSLVSTEKTNTIAKVKERVKNREMLRASHDIALKVLIRLDELDWKKTDLAEKLGVSKQQVSKITSGKENHTLETIVKLEKILDIPILATFYEKPSKESLHYKIKLQIEEFGIGEVFETDNYKVLSTSTRMKSISSQFIYQLRA
jgi:transcriptional regulator with XRE-family HTH domain